MGGLMQLVAFGVQDLYIIGNPQITFFKAIYHRHTNFSIESVRQPIDGEIDFGKTISAKISRDGDLLHKLMLEVDLPQITASGSVPSGSAISWVNSIGHALVEEIELYIGELLVDKQYGEWLEIWSELATDSSKRDGYNNMVSKYESHTTVTGPITVFIPLQFWFCRNVGLALPLVSLQYHDVRVRIKLRSFDTMWTWGPNDHFTVSKSGTTVTATSSAPEFTSDDVGKVLYWNDGTSDTITAYTNATTVTVSGSGTKSSQRGYTKPANSVSQTYSINDARFFADFIYLDTFERKQFALKPHDYLIEQIQFSDGNSYVSGQNTLNIKLDFNLPIKEICWVSQLDRYAEAYEYFNYSDTVDPLAIQGDPITDAVIYFNGVERFEQRKAKYFRLVQPYYHHTRAPTSHIYVYSFAVNPEKYQPSGTANFSQIDTVDLRLTFKTTLPATSVRVYGVSYNILRVENGMGGLIFAD